ncbi:hypothetical protein GH714_013879 [Hevea brasiliensis]|uniref:Uncharacterized protein n=1 Tax=Hevea brasiliensis TaxID=3981 RepID=A0A6A6LPZ0_HEVBR|nr:hypothetical protein GH714_013879 [Hevea brasiliensis]
MNWDALGDQDDDDDRFFETRDRLSSAVPLDLASSGSDDEDEFEDTRLSFASAISSVSTTEFRNYAVAAAAAMSPDYDIWMAAPGSINERRKRLFQGMGLSDDKERPWRRYEARGFTSTDTRSSGPFQARIYPYLDSVRVSPKDAGNMRSLEHNGGIMPLSSDNKFGAFFLIKNLDTGKEFIVNEYNQDGMWNKVSDLQTGKQLTMEEFEKCVGHSRIVKELMSRENVSRMNGDDRKNSQ